MIAPWFGWEDYAAGMYEPLVVEAATVDSVRLLTDESLFAETAAEMLRAWPLAARHNLLVFPSGHNAWIGQASACYGHGATGATTRVAWGRLTNSSQRVANGVATDVCATWRKEVTDGQAVLDL